MPYKRKLSLVNLQKHSEREISECLLKTIKRHSRWGTLWTQTLTRKHTLPLALTSGLRENRHPTEGANAACSQTLTLTLGGFGSFPNPLHFWDPLYMKE